MDEVKIPSSAAIATEKNSSSEKPPHQVGKEQENDATTIEEALETTDDGQFLTGTKLALVLCSLTVTVFIMFLDMSIIVTVSAPRSLQSF